MTEDALRTTHAQVELVLPGIYDLLSALEVAGISVEYSSDPNSQCQQVYSAICRKFKLQVKTR